MKIVLCGPPHSGKSCLRYGLKEAIKAIDEKLYPYVITACPDGEGSWFQETASLNPNLAGDLKTPYKAKFTDDRAALMAEWVRNCNLPLTLIDIGGIPDEKNERICSSATHAIILYRDPSQIPEWIEFCERLNLRVIAVIFSDYGATADRSLVLSNGDIYRGSVHFLERGDLSVRQRPTVIQLATLLVQMATSRKG